jgi:hypothetical protein
MPSERLSGASWTMPEAWLSETQAHGIVDTRLPYSEPPYGYHVLYSR